MSLRCMPFLLLTAITLQGVFGGLSESVIICLGANHQEAPTEVAEKCDSGCSNHGDWPAPVPEPTDDHQGDSRCTDIELALIVLLTTPRAADQDLTFLPPMPEIIEAWHHPSEETSPSSRELIWKEDPGGEHRRALVRSTRMLV